MSQPQSHPAGVDEEDFDFDLSEDDLLLYDIVQDWEAESSCKDTRNALALLPESIGLDEITSGGGQSTIPVDIEELPTLLLLEEAYRAQKLDREEVEGLEKARIDATHSPYDRFRSYQNRLTVTDLVQPGWCELQFQYGLESRKPRQRTPAMKRGHELHDALEKELHAVVKVVLDPEIREERVGLRLLNLLLGLSELDVSNMTRELPVFGFINQTFVSGIIDQLQFKSVKDRETNKSKQLMENYFGRTSAHMTNLVLSDHKSRVTRFEPSQSQENQARLQLMVYWQLFGSMPDLTVESLAAIDSSDPERQFSNSFKSQALEKFDGQPIENDMLQAIESNTISSYWTLAQEKIRQALKRMSDTLEINYIHQSSGELISTKTFNVDKEWAVQQAADILAWWHGNRDPRGVPVEQAIKCSYCEYAEGCSWRLRQIRVAIDRKRGQSSRHA